MGELKTNIHDRRHFIQTANDDGRTRDLCDDVETLWAENQRLRDCLAWYADEENQCDTYCGGDGGYRARKALGNEANNG